ncbi:MAG TPA: hypothetical protein VGS12_11595 [Caulobacteraceae bacterium]|nr:hypothetical protein [Caulobacteraceae bacterium]
MTLVHEAEIAGDWRAGRNTAATQKGSIHDDATASKLGFKGGTVAGSLHMDQFAPLLVKAFGEGWLKRGNVSLYFRQATTDGERVRASVRPGERHARLWMENEAGDLIMEGTASAGRADIETELVGRLAGQARAAKGALRILGQVAEGDTVEAVAGRIGAEAVAARLKTIPETMPQYQADPPVLPPSLAVHLYRAAQTKLLKLAGPVVGLFGAIELQALAGPLTAETDYILRARVLALSESPKTENVWFQAWAADPASGEDVGWMIMYLRFMKASSPLWR